jgi:hypothetical protein
VLLTKIWPTYKMLTSVNHSLSLVAMHVSPSCWAPTIRVLTLAYRYSDENNGEEYWSDFEEFYGMRIPQSCACGSWRKSCSFSYRLSLDLRVHRLSVINEYCIGYTLLHLITVMVLHSFVYHVCVILILTHILPRAIIIGWNRWDPSFVTVGNTSRD